MEESKQIAAVLVAGGRGQRAGDGIPKQYREVGGVAMIRHAAAALRDAGIKTIQPVIHPDDGDLFDAAMAHGPGTLEPVAGGATRQASGLAGLRALRDLAPELVLIHDAARPFPAARLVGRVIDALGRSPGVIPALPVVDSLRRTQSGAAAGTVSRDGLYRVQTPQGFHFDAILQAHEAMSGSAIEMTDDAAVAEAFGLEVAMVDGDEDNIKVTTPADFERAERLLSWRVETRTGTGFDVHRFGEGDMVTLCGVSIAHDHALAGHSDADVAWHALTDALLGTIGAGDIGSHFPPSDPAYRGMSSGIFLTHAAELIRNRNGRIVNLDVTIICEAPKIGPYRASMIASTASTLDIDPARISIKATTTEQLGFTGRREGIAAQATATVTLPIY